MSPPIIHTIGVYGSSENEFFQKLIDTKKIVLFCVERSPDACHRSLVTNKMKEVYPDLHIFNLQLHNYYSNQKM
jgi:hypothetical protein